MKRKSLLLMMLLALFSSGAWAQSEYHSYSNINHTYGSSSSLSTYNSDRYPERLFDNDLDTKYCAVFNYNTWPGWLSVNFESNDFIIPSKYVIYTGDDTQSNPGRNPKNWHIEASVDGTNWETIHTVTDADLPATDETRVEYTISGVTTAYKYFRFYIESIESGSTFQLQDFHFIATVQGGGGDGSFTVLEDFETGGFNKLGWTFAGNANWTSVNSDPYEGSYCAKSGSISDKQQTDLIFTGYFADGTISFYKRVSSEITYDKLHFYIDGIEKGSWSGSIDWSQESYAVTAGTHTLKWSYTKDVSASSGSDCAWVDNISLPLVPPITIATKADWNLFCAAVESGHDYYDQTVTMTDDVGLDDDGPVTTICGAYTDDDNYKAFKGTFDGDGHTLYFELNNMGKFSAPFKIVEDATIQNLRTAGSITGNLQATTELDKGKVISGLVAISRGTTYIIGCSSSMDITSYFEGGNDVTLAGLVASTKGGNLTVEGCAFEGSMTAGKTTTYANHNSGIVAYPYDPVTVTVRNTVFAPWNLDTKDNDDRSWTFARIKNNTTTVNISNCYYTLPLTSYTDNIQGKELHTITGDTDVTVALNGTETDYGASGIKAYKNDNTQLPGLVYNGTVIAGNGDNVSLTLGYTGEGTVNQYTHNGIAFTDDSNPYSLTMPNENVVIAVANISFTKEIKAYGNSERGGYYLIASPLAADVDPATVTGMITDNLDATEVEANGTYDLYSFNQAQELEWKNYRKDNFNLVNGTGYLYASKGGTTLTFSGAPYSGDTKTVTLSKTEEATGLDFPTWNLVGNPFAVDDAYITKSFYTLEKSDTYTLNTASDAIHPMQGLFVVADEDGETLTFSKTPNREVASLNMNVSKVATRGVSAGSTNVVDQAIISFTEGQELPKLQFRNGSTKVYLPMDGKEYAIVSAKSMGTMPVNFKAEDNGTYTLDFTTKEVSFNYLHLIDNMNGNDVDLLQTPYYTFDAKSTDYASRFTLVFATGSSTGSETDNFAFFNNGNWIINNDGEASLQIVDVMGRILSSETISGSCSKAINVATGVYMLRLINGNDVKVQKIVVR